jgi:hypothetical protein
MDNVFTYLNDGSNERRLADTYMGCQLSYLTYYIDAWDRYWEQ